MSRRARRSSLRFRLVAAAVALIAFLLLGEGYARFVNPIVPGWQGADPGDVIMVGHPTRLWGMGPGVRNNAGAKATINDLGLRGETPRLPRPRGRERVMITGDSSFFGHGVADDQTPAALLALELHAAGIDAETVNAAVPGYSTEQTLLLLDEVGWSLEPSLLVVGNVWSDYNFDHFRDEDLLRTQQVFSGQLLGNSAFYRLVAGAVDRTFGGRGAHIVTWTQHSSFPAEGVRRVPPRRYAENLDRLVREAATHGAEVIFLQPTNRDMARGDLSGAEVRGPYFDAQAAVAAWHGIAVVHTLPAFTEAALEAGPDQLFLDDLHPSALGNRVVAEAILTTLLATHWPTEPHAGRPEPFDASAVTDTTPERLAASPGLTTPASMSPQVNLFPGGAASVTGSQSSVSTSAAASWILRGTVVAPPGPVEVMVRSLGDDKLGSAVLRGDPSFAIPIPPGHPTVRVEAMGAEGRVVAEAQAGAAPLVLTLGKR